MPVRRSISYRPALGTILVGVALLLLSRWNRMDPNKGSLERRLIVSSDDAGMCSSVNRATIDALENGIVTSVSIMVCCPKFEEFAAYATAHPERDYGVHLTLTCNISEQPWGPVSPVSEVPSLVDGSGHFWPTVADVAASARVEDVERELRAQIDRAMRAGIRITHIDHHMWVMYARNDLLDLYARLAVGYGLPARICLEPAPAGVLRAEPDSLSTHRRCVETLHNAGLPLLDAMESENYDQQPGSKRAFHIETLRRVRFGVTELVVHCADAGGVGVQPPHVDRRAADARFVSSEEARQEINRLRIHLTDWAEFRRSTFPSR